jgi:hypothetical protein
MNESKPAIFMNETSSFFRVYVAEFGGKKRQSGDMV